MKLDYIDLFLAHWPFSFQAAQNIVTAQSFQNATPAERGEAVGEDGKITIDWEHSCETIVAVNGKRGSYKSTWRELQRLVGTGKLRAVGVSNFNIEQLQEVLSVKGDVPVSCNQIEGHPWFPNTDLINFIKKEGILATMYSPFAPKKEPPFLLEDAEVKHLAEKNKMGIGQLLQSWAVQRGTIPLGKSQTPCK